jgi:hypothetical protein
MNLMERSLAEQHHELYSVELARPAVEIVVRQSAARQREAFVEAAELRPHRLLHEQRIALPHGSEPPARRRRRERADGEQPVAVVFPARPGEQLILGGLIVTGVERIHVARRTEMPAQRRDDRPRREHARELRTREQPGTREPRAVDENTDEVTLGHFDAEVRRASRRGRRGIDPGCA